jgi:4-hydroxy-tetrahydrodipicolinate reductase
MTRIAICGAAGRMGRTLLEVCRDTEGVSLGAAIEHAGSPVLGMDAGEMAGIGRQDVTVVSDINQVVADFDVLIDFTLADAVLANLESCRAAGKRMVLGTTGLDDGQKQAIHKAAADIAIVFAPNMSIGVNLVFRLAQLAARIIGADTDIEIIEAHHNQKQDAPSGTAVRLGEIIAAELGRDLKDCAVYGRQGHTGVRDPKTIGFETIRAGDIVGDHTVMFAASGERVEITHKASSRKTFANGAIRASRWVMEKESGLYDMQDVLGLGN